MGFEVHRNGSNAMFRNVTVSSMAFLTLVDLFPTRAILSTLAPTCRLRLVVISAH
ncbi:MAG TPA: hypothetical protein VFU71_12815 [Burkholderiaceae bacterium]|nr:hypothetical protein [Burkholderiaceae bacterium]